MTDHQTSPSEEEMNEETEIMPPHYCTYGSNMNFTRMVQRVGVKAMHDEPPALIILDGSENNPALFLSFHKQAYKNPMEGFATLQKNPVKKSDPPARALCWRVEPRAIHALDGYEGVATNQYVRETWTLRSSEGHDVRGAIYIAHPSKVRDGLRPSKMYLSHLLAGMDHGLDEDYVRWLDSHETLESTIPDELGGYSVGLSSTTSDAFFALSIVCLLITAMGRIVSMKGKAKTRLPLYHKQ